MPTTDTPTLRYIPATRAQPRPPAAAPEELCRAEARARVRRALEQIEAAQNLIGSACATLSSLQYAAPEWRATSKLYDRIKAHWYRVRDGIECGSRAGKVRLDPMAATAFLQRCGAPAAAASPSTSES